MKRTGIVGLSRAVRALNLQTQDPVETDFAASSIGSLNMDFLESIYLAASGADLPVEKREVDIKDRFRIYFPTHDTVAASTGGTQNGGTVCFQSKWYNSDTSPKTLFRDYQSTRTGLLSHNKILFSRSQKQAWAYVGGANISGSAWGKAFFDKAKTLHTYFGKCFAAQYQIPLKHIALQNFYGPNNSEFDRIYDVKKLESVTLINSLGGANGNPLTVYFDDTWNMTHPDLSLSVKMMRSDAIGRPHVDLISRSSGLEELYLIDPKNNLWSQSMSGTPATVEPSLATPSFTPKQSPDFETHLLGKDYLHAITSKQGSTMRHLLLSDQWSLSAEDLSLLVRSCPNLSQLGLAVEMNNPHFLRLLIPFLPKLFALRLLNHRNTWNADTDMDLVAADDDAHICGIGRDSWQAGYRNLKWIGVGERVFELGNVCQMEGERGEIESRRQVRRVSLSAVKHVEIWKLDAMEI
ncbi:hypothetical protein B0A49_11975 [Cryomyces minteri]|uniref:PLD phosphodiesterase domain-containing protein n=1 Tax=Cryomyces minteri TaxID=331657 RepID=A0A4U0VXP7_9PEZI|nr:hypothetical protein B0A49_11975 [Cryomyces minteri]